MVDKEPQKIVVLMPNWVGDSVMATPTLRALRARWPDARICIAGISMVVSTAFDPNISDCCIELPKKKRGSLLSSARLLRRERFDMAIILPNSFRSALIAFLAGIKRRVGYSRDGRGVLLTDKMNPPTNHDGKKAVYPTLDYYADLLGLLDIEVTDRQMSLSADRELSKAELSCTGYDAQRPLVMLNPGGSFGPSKLWPTDRYAALADRIVDTYDAQIIINAAPNEHDIALAVSGAMKNKPILNYAQRENSLAILKSNLGVCDLLVTNDTGARHVAIAMKTAVVTIYGSTDPKWTTLDYDRQRDISADVECGPCQQKECPLSENRLKCLDAVSVDEVFAAVSELLGDAEAGA